MQQLTFTTTIAAPAHKVWQVLWSNESYRKWTAFFGDGTYAESDWQQGSYVKFMDNKQDGLYSKIVKNEMAAIMQFEHLAELKNGNPEYDSEDAKEWKGAKEIYTLTEANGSTGLQVFMDVPERYFEYFKDVFSQCIDKVKTLAESEVN